MMPLKRKIVVAEMLTAYVTTHPIVPGAPEVH